MQEVSSIIVSGLLSGGFAAALITPTTNALLKRRENEREIKKYRMEILSQYITLYNRLALYTNGISQIIWIKPILIIH